jgi:hypothetical protein
VHDHHEVDVDVDVDDPQHQAFRATADALVSEWRHRVIDLREPVDPALDLRYLPEPIQAAAPVIIDLVAEERRASIDA